MPNKSIRILKKIYHHEIGDIIELLPEDDPYDVFYRVNRGGCVFKTYIPKSLQDDVFEYVEEKSE